MKKRTVYIFGAKDMHIKKSEVSDNYDLYIDAQSADLIVQLPVPILEKFASSITIGKEAKE